MAEYIEQKATCNDCLHYELCKYNTYQQAHYFGKDKEIYITIDNDTPCKFFKNKADVVEAKRGEWVTHRTSKRLPMVLYKCSVCGYERIGKANFCEDCGADMRPLNAVKE